MNTISRKFCRVSGSQIAGIGRNECVTEILIRCYCAGTIHLRIQSGMGSRDHSVYLTHGWVDFDLENISFRHLYYVAGIDYWSRKRREEYKKPCMRNHT